MTQHSPESQCAEKPGAESKGKAAGRVCHFVNGYICGTADCYSHLSGVIGQGNV